MIVLWQVGLTRKRAKMAILKHLLRFQLQDPALILIRFSLPLAFPNDRSTFSPIRDNVRAEHIVFDQGGIDKGVPYFGDRSIDFNMCLRSVCVIHGSSYKVIRFN